MEYITLPLKEGDTLESIAKEYDLAIEHLMLMHNQKADMYYKIMSRFEGFRSHVTEYYIYKEVVDKRYQKELRSRPMNHHNTFYKPVRVDLIYGVQLTIEDDNETTNLKFETVIEFINRTEDKNQFIVSIDRTGVVYYNDEDDSIVANELAQSIGAVLYPLEIIVTPRGEFVGINNYEEIVKRWEGVKEAILKKHEGEWVAGYLQLTQKTLANQDMLFNTLKKDWVLSSYFNKTYIDHTNKYKVERTIAFPLISTTAPLEYTVEQTLNEYLDDNGNVVIAQTGTLTDLRNIEDLENNLNEPMSALIYPDAPKAEGEYHSKYFLNPEDQYLESLYINCTALGLQNPKKATIVMTLQNSFTLSY